MKATQDLLDIIKNDVLSFNFFSLRTTMAQEK